MPPLSPEIIQILSILTIAVTGPTFAKMLVLFQGTIPTSGRRTIAAALRAMGLRDEQA